MSGKELSNPTGIKKWTNKHKNTSPLAVSGVDVFGCTCLLPWRTLVRSERWVCPFSWSSPTSKVKVIPHRPRRVFPIVNAVFKKSSLSHPFSNHINDLSSSNFRNQCMRVVGRHSFKHQKTNCWKNILFMAVIPWPWSKPSSCQQTQKHAKFHPGMANGSFKWPVFEYPESTKSRHQTQSPNIKNPPRECLYLMKRLIHLVEVTTHADPRCSCHKLGVVDGTSTESCGMGAIPAIPKGF